ncbi:MAG: B12-binding domain-containing radical SAM protein [Nitrospirae bacterium]|nr:B12-binding domain-containing radical SAM protein [Nitrospirota bacterium]MCL5976695.1 B12-binding domain-containing radical SAM protein [Nitrospirota bacterium]
MKDRIILIQPKNTLSLNIYPPLNLIQIGTALKAAGHEVRIFTCPTENNYLPGILQECTDALFVGMSVLTPEIPNAVKIASTIKENFDIPIVWGGWHATLFPEQMAQSHLVDKVVVDEGDEAIVRLAKYYRTHGHRTGDKDKIITGHNKLDMENLPCPDYSLVSNIELYINSFLPDKFLEYDPRNVRWLPYQASRGCPGRCSFCINVVTGNRRYRHKSSDKVVDEIKIIVSRHGINHLKIIDDNLFVNIDWIKAIARRLIDERLGITWDAECRVDYFTENKVNSECLELLVKSGLNELNFGIESGSQKTLDMIKKGITPQQSLNAVRKSADHGIVSRCSFIIDMPGERPEDIFETVKLINEIRKMPRTTCGVHTYRPYPRSELCEDLLKRGEISQPSSLEEWSDGDYIKQFTYADAKRKWQKNYRLSSKISFYQNLESGFWLRPHQINNSLARRINAFFMDIARIRNHELYFGLPIDRYLFALFKYCYYRYREMRKKT